MSDFKYAKGTTDYALKLQAQVTALESERDRLAAENCVLRDALQAFNPLQARSVEALELRANALASKPSVHVAKLEARLKRADELAAELEKQEKGGYTPMEVDVLFALRAFRESEGA